MATIDIFEIIFETLLRIDPSIISNYTNVQDQLLYLIFIPHVVILFFLWSFGYWMVGARGHRGIRYLMTIAGYVFIIMSGWYGSWMLPIIIAWFPIMLGGMFLFFIITRILPPKTIGGMHDVIGEVGAARKSMVDKTKSVSALKKEKTYIIKNIKELQRAIQAERDPRIKATLIQQLRQEKGDFHVIEQKLRELR